MNFENIGLLSDNTVFVKGSVMDTLDTDMVPSEISVIRMDTDLYESTKKQLTILYPGLSEGGVLFEDDYGTYDGPRLAIEEYFKDMQKPVFKYIDAHGIMAIKQEDTA
jgi:hypothetical protein